MGLGFAILKVVAEAASILTPVPPVGALVVPSSVTALGGVSFPKLPSAESLVELEDPLKRLPELVIETLGGEAGKKISVSAVMPQFEIVSSNFSMPIYFPSLSDYRSHHVTDLSEDRLLRGGRPPLSIPPWWQLLGVEWNPFPLGSGKLSSSSLSLLAVPANPIARLPPLTFSKAIRLKNALN